MPIDCATFRQTCVAEPACREPSFLEHAAGCEACAAHQRAMLRMQSLLERALKVPVPEFPPLGPARRSLSVAGRLGIAATVALAAITAAWVVNSQRLGRSLARDVIAHVVGEPESLLPKRAPLPAAEVARALAGHHVALPAKVGEVVYAQSCLFHGRQIPHLVVRTPDGLVSVLILPEERVTGSVAFGERGLAALVIPAIRGVVAIAADGGVAEATKASVAAALLATVYQRSLLP